MIASPVNPSAAKPATPAPPAAPATAPTPIAQLYRQIWQHAQGARLQLAAALSMLGASQALKLALPWLAAQAINSIQTAGRNGLATAGLWIAAILALHAGSWLLHGPARVLERGVALRVRRSAAALLYARLAQAPLAWHEQQHSGELQQRVAQASSALQGFTQTQFIYLSNVIQIVGPLLALWWLSTVTGALALVGFVLIACAVLRFDRRLVTLAVQENDAERRYAARLMDFVGNIGAVASLRLQAATKRLLDARLVAVFQPLSRSIVINEWKWCTVDLSTVALGWALVAVYAAATLGGGVPGVPGPGAAGAVGGTLLIGSLFMVHQYAQQAAGVLGSMAAHYQGLVHIQADCASATLIHRAPAAHEGMAGSDTDDSRDDTLSGVQPPPPVLAHWRQIELRGIGYAHAGSDGSPSGVQALDLLLQRGERVALVGPSGCGKSTLLRLLAGLYAAQQGTLCIDGVVQRGRHAGALATLIPQEADVFEGSLRENLCFGQSLPEPALHAALHSAALDDAVARWPQGLDTPVAERGANLSGGQRQRLALARGVLAAQDCSLLLLDEPTSALDAHTEQQVQQRLGQSFGNACIVAAVHRLALLPHFDRVVFMVAGRIIDIGSCAELTARQPAFAALCASTPGSAPANAGRDRPAAPLAQAAVPGIPAPAAAARLPEAASPQYPHAAPGGMPIAQPG